MPQSTYSAPGCPTIDDLPATAPQVDAKSAWQEVNRRVRALERSAEAVQLAGAETEPEVLTAALDVVRRPAVISAIRRRLRELGANWQYTPGIRYGRGGATATTGPQPVSPVTDAGQAGRRVGP